MSSNVVRVCFVGDSYTAGTGDETCMGWVGRVAASAWKRGDQISFYNLGIRGDTSALIAKRWRAECEARVSKELNGRLVFSFGINDTARLVGGDLRVSHDESVQCAQAMLREASAWLPTLWIGPTPANEAMSPMSPSPGISYAFSNERLLALNAAYGNVAASLGIPFLDLATPLTANEDYQRSLLQGDSMHCSGQGYALIADMIDGWSAWRKLLKDH
jgi:acyl-CoA thioesterase I